MPSEGGARHGAESRANGAPGSQTLARGLAALQLVASSRTGLTAQQVADDIGVHRTIAYRLLTTLAQYRMVAKGEDGRYRPAAGTANRTRRRSRRRGLSPGAGKAGSRSAARRNAARIEPRPEFQAPASVIPGATQSGRWPHQRAPPRPPPREPQASRASTSPIPAPGVSP